MPRLKLPPQKVAKVAQDKARPNSLSAQVRVTPTIPAEMQLLAKIDCLTASKPKLSGMSGKKNFSKTRRTNESAVCTREIRKDAKKTPFNGQSCSVGVLGGFHYGTIEKKSSRIRKKTQNTSRDTDVITPSLRRLLMAIISVTVLWLFCCLFSYETESFEVILGFSSFFIVTLSL